MFSNIFKNRENTIMDSPVPASNLNTLFHVKPHPLPTTTPTGPFPLESQKAYHFIGMYLNKDSILI